MAATFESLYQKKACDDFAQRVMWRLDPAINASAAAQGAVPAAVGVVPEILLGVVIEVIASLVSDCIESRIRRAARRQRDQPKSWAALADRARLALRVPANALGRRAVAQAIIDEAVDHLAMPHLWAPMFGLAAPPAHPSVWEGRQS